jgi:DNA replication protein DnaC
MDNCPIEDWGQLLGDMPAATASLDRFLQQAEIIQITGRSYRLRNAQAQSSSEPEKEKKNGGSAEKKR